MDNYQNPEPNKTYISPSLPDFGDKARRVRIASKSLNSVDGYEYVKERDEIVVRKKPDAATYISAKFMEDTRNVFVLTIQKFRSETKEPYGSGFSFVGKEIESFCNFLSNIKSMGFQNDRAVNITDEELMEITITSKQAERLVSENEDLFAEVVRNSITKSDVVAISYRKQQLEIFKKLLHDIDFFNEQMKRCNCTNEALWQRYFEKNPWIFGYGLGYIFLSELDGKKLEQVVLGYSVSNSGKRVDALMKTKGIISNTCFVEIKTHKTKLLKTSPYRSSCWSPSDDLAGAISQVQGTVASALENLSTKVNLTDSTGDPTGEEIFNYQPKSFLVVGCLDEFVTEHGTNQSKLRSFELLRKNTINPEIITFDELYERAKFIVHQNQS